MAVIAEEVATKLQGLLLGEQCIFSRPFPLEELKVPVMRVGSGSFGEWTREKTYPLLSISCA